MNKELIKTNVMKICMQVRTSGLKTINNIVNKKMFFINNEFCVIEGDGLNAYEEIIHDLMSDDFIKKKFSQKFLEIQLNTFISRVFKKSESELLNEIDSYLEQLRDIIKSEIYEYKFIYPIANLELSKTIKIGDVNFFRFLDKEEEIERHFFGIIDKNEKAETGKQIRKNTLRNEFKKIRGMVCAEVVVHGEELKCCEISYKKIENTLDIFRLFSPLSVYFQKSFIGVSGYLSSSNSLFFYSNKLSYSINEQAKGFLIPLEVNDDFINRMEKNGLKRINSLLTKCDNDLQESLLIAIHWFGKAIKEVEDKDRVIYFSVALEALLIKDKKEEVNKNLSQRVAFIIGSNKKEREEVYKRFKDLYDLRSRILHLGFIKIPQESIIEFHRVASQVIIFLINSKFSNRNEVFQYIEGLIFN